MRPLPETRESLLLRMRDTADAAAWEEFVDIYRPMVFRLAQRSGMQDCDADDLSQRVLMSVARAVEHWEKDASRGTFRSWLRTVARNAIINMLQRGPKEEVIGGSDFLAVCNSKATLSNDSDRMIEEEYTRSLLRAAGTRVESMVRPTTWQSFWRTAIVGDSPSEVADEFGIPIGKVYGARARVMKLLQKAAAEMNAEGVEVDR